MGRPPCCDREEAGVKKGPWTPEEDLVLVSYVQEHGPGNWRAVPAKTGLMRCSKSCRLRWTNYLRPGIRRGGFSDQEDRLIAHLQALLGNRWAAIASYLPDRTDNDVKNYWNTHLKKRLRLLMQQQEQTTTPRDASSPSTSLPPPPSSSDNKGKWELRLQTDIGLARRALREALSVDAAARPCPPAPGTRSTTSPALLPGDEPVAATAPPYARNNVSTMLDLDGWVTPASGSSSELTADCSTAAPGSTSSASNWTTTVRQDDDVTLSAIESWLLGDDGGEQQLAAQEGILLEAALQFMA